MTDGLAVESVGLRFPGGGWGLRGATLRIRHGEVLTVVGPSGAGKTSLLRLVCGLARPTEGTIAMRGTDVTAVPPEHRPVAMVFQGYALFPHMTARENIAFGLRVRKEKDVDKSVGAAAEALRISDKLDRRPNQLSGGERQRVALARALVRRPAVFCLDEPLSSLDPVLRADARLMLREVLRAEGRCALVVTHDQHEALTMGDEVAILNGGSVEQVGTPRQVYAKPRTPFVASFIGQPPMSIVRLKLKQGERLVGVRPEHVRLIDGSSATVMAVEHLGHESHVVLHFRGQRLVARTGPDDSLREGDRVGVHIRRGHMHVFES